MRRAELQCAFFGDSITAGQHVSTRLHWTALIRERLTHSGLTEVHYSVGAVSGDTTRMGLERFPGQVQAVQPHVLTIQFGLNDCNRWRTDGGLPRVSELAFGANLLEMIGRARQFGTTQVILLTTHPTLRTTIFDDDTTYEDSRRRYNEVCRRVAREADVQLCDIEAAFDPLAYRLAELLIEPPDVLHLSAAGHQVYADLLEPVLRASLLTERRLAEGPQPLHGRSFQGGAGDHDLMKTTTDEHWDERARGVDDAASVNIEDVYQRELELEFICSQLTGGERLLEVGCGNGFNTTRYRDRVASVDAFDFSGEMITRADVDHPDPNVRYYEASVLDPDAAPAGGYDVVVCIRTLINLADLAAQRTAVENMFSWVRPGGRLVLVEGFSDGFQALSELRQSLSLSRLVPASINLYCTVAEIQDLLEQGGDVVATFHTGTWDVLTRVVLPLIAGSEHAQGVGPFHPGLLELARLLGNDRTERFARVRGWAVRQFDTR